MDVHIGINQDEAVVRFYCDICRIWHIDGDAGPVAVCHYCGSPLRAMFDYACAGCGQFTCDNCCQACQEDDCDAITCFSCVESHLQDIHPLAGSRRER